MLACYLTILAIVAHCLLYRSGAVSVEFKFMFRQFPHFSLYASYRDLQISFAAIDTFVQFSVFCLPYYLTEFLNIQLVYIHRGLVGTLCFCRKIIQKSTFPDAIVVCIVGVFVYRSGVFSLLIAAYVLHFAVDVVSIMDFLHAVAPLVVGVCLT